MYQGQNFFTRQRLFFFFFFASVLYLYLATVTLHWIPNRWTPRTVEYFPVEDVSIFVDVRIGPFKVKANDLDS